MLEPIIHTIKIDLARKGAPVVVDATQGDSLSRKIIVNLYNNGVAWTIPDDVKSAVFAYAKPDGTGGKYDKLPDNSAACEIGTNSVSAILAPQVLTCTGLVRAAIKLAGADNAALYTFPFQISVVRSPEDGIESDNYSNVDSLETISAEVKQLDSRVEKVENSYVKSVNSKQRDTSGNVEIGTDDITAEVRATGYQGNLGGALESVGVLALPLDVKVTRDTSGTLTANVAYSEIKTAQTAGRKIRVFYAKNSAEVPAVFHLAQKKEDTSVLVFAAACDFGQQEWAVRTLICSSNNQWGEDEYFFPAPPASSNSGKVLKSNGSGWEWADAASGVKDATDDWNAWAATQSTVSDWIGCWAAAAGDTDGSYRVPEGTYKILAYDEEICAIVQISPSAFGRQIIYYYIDDTNALIARALLVYEPGGELTESVMFDGGELRLTGYNVSVPPPSASQTGYVLMATGANQFSWQPLPS